jgi:hypothetical protein
LLEWFIASKKVGSRGVRIMKRRMKKTLINQPIGLDNIKLDDLDDGDNGEWNTEVTGPKARHHHGSKRKSHGSLSALHIRHMNKHSRGRGFFQ